MKYTLDELSNINYQIERLLTVEDLGLKIFYNERMREYQELDEPNKTFYSFNYIDGLERMRGLPSYFQLTEYFDIKTGQIKELSDWHIYNEHDGIRIYVNFKNETLECYVNGEVVSWKKAKKAIKRHLRYFYTKLTTIDYLDISDLLIKSEKEPPEFF